MPKLSIIIPVWGAERWLTDSVQSILRQSFRDFELLLVEDGSPDRSGEICDSLALTDSRIRVFHKSNGGPASARNLGLAQAKGEYVSFADPDDALLPGALETGVAAMEQGYDVVSYGFEYCYPTGNTMNTCPGFTCQSIEQFWSHFIQYYQETNQFCSSCNKFYRMELIRKYAIEFPSYLRNGEDTAFNFAYFHHCQRICCLDWIGYRYYYRSGSLTQNISSDHLTICEETIQRTTAFLKENGAPTYLARQFEDNQLRINVTSYYAVLTDSTRGYSLSERIRRLKKIFSIPRYRDVLLPWLKEQQGLPYIWLRFAAAFYSPVLTALPVALKAALRGGHHA